MYTDSDGARPKDSADLDTYRLLKAWYRRLLSFLLFVAILLSLWPFGTLLHELGHGVVAVAFGGRITYLELYGVEIYPDFGSRHRGGPFEYFGRVGTDRGGHFETWQRGWLLLMGSGSTLLVSLVAHGLLWRYRPARRLPRYIVIAFALFYLDMVTYTFTGPLGLRRAILVGGYARPEPLEGAAMLGIPGPVFMLFNLFVLIGLTYSVFHFLRTADHPPKLQRHP